jgi:hypothetical protein
MGCSPYDPLTTINSPQESIMADANHKARPSRTKPHTRTSATPVLGNSPDYGPTPDLQQPCMPWMQLADIWLGCAGFSPGQRVFFSFDYRNRCLSITPDHG